MIEYIDGEKRALFNGLVFVRDDCTGYYLNSTLRVRLHRAVYEYYYGAIPDGYHVHHIDHDKTNNKPENLCAMPEVIHHELHAKEQTEEERERKKASFIRNAVAAASAWHKSEEGRAWHLKHYEQMKGAMHAKTWMTCKQCEKGFYGVANGQTRFCSKACKSAWRRKAGLDDVERKCLACGRSFTANKYSGTRTCSRSCANRWRAAIRKDQGHTAQTTGAGV